MRVTYPVLETIKKTGATHNTNIDEHKRSDHIQHTHVKDYHRVTDLIALYNRQGDLKRYFDSHHIDIFV